MKNCVYRFLNANGELLYIGKANNLKNRMQTHNHLPPECYSERSTIDYYSFNSEEEMNMAERYLIAKYKPRFNTVYKQNEFSFCIPELENIQWSIFSSEFNVREEIALLKQQIHEIQQRLGGFNKDSAETEIKVYEGEEVVRSFRLNAEVQARFKVFCKQNSTYKVSDILNTALDEFMRKHS